MPSPHLPWLELPPEDFRSRCKELSAQTPDLGLRIHALAQFALQGTATEALARAIRRLVGAGADISGLRPVRLAVLSNATMDLVQSELLVAGARHGLLLDITLGSFGQFYQEAMDPNSPVHQARPDFVIAALDHRAFGLEAAPGDGSAASRGVAQALDLLRDMRRGLGRNGATVIVQTLPQPQERLFGSADPAIGGSLAAMIDDFNRRLADDLRDGSDVLLDAAHLAALVGLGVWHDPTHWHASKLPFSPDFFPLYAEHAARLLGAVCGQSRRCLVLDLDNTLWGGVIGDDGLEGIVLGQGSGTGEAFVDIQRAALSLHQRGIMLAVCSKNDPETARLPFHHHPDMILREDHFAAFFANWEDKAANLRAIASTLNIGLDALVFVDDNPAERALIRRELPAVAVPELPGDPALIPAVLFSAGYFESTRLTDGDRDRNRSYAQNAERDRLRERVTNVDDYLRSLEMTAVVVPFAAVDRARIAQLIGKTNQFNLTGLRWTEAEIAAMETDPETFTLAARLRDRFGDNGLISALAVEKRKGQWRILNWAMSCRVFQRRIEHAMLNELAAAARADGAVSLIGEYRPSSRNDLVKGLYPSLGFRATDAEGGCCWELDLNAFGGFDIPIRLESVDSLQGAGT